MMIAVNILSDVRSVLGHGRGPARGVAGMLRRNPAAMARGAEARRGNYPRRQHSLALNADLLCLQGSGLPEFFNGIVPPWRETSRT